MRKVFLMGAVILLGGAVGVAVAQERLPQASGFGTGVGESAGTGTRSQIWDKTALLERLSQPETIYGRVLAIDVPGRKIHLETGGSSHDEGRAGTGALSEVRAYLDEFSNYDQLKTINQGDDVIVMVVEATTAQQPFGTGKKMVRDIQVLRGNEKLAGFGGLGQRPNPNTERGIETNSGSGTGGPVGLILPGEVTSATGFTSQIGEVTGAAPCWNCDPQPGWGYAGTSKTDYGGSEKPQMKKGLDAQAQ